MQARNRTRIADWSPADQYKDDWDAYQRKGARRG